MRATPLQGVFWKIRQLRSMVFIQRVISIQIFKTQPEIEITIRRIQRSGGRVQFLTYHNQTVGIYKGRIWKTPEHSKFLTIKSSDKTDTIPALIAHF